MICWTEREREFGREGDGVVGDGGSEIMRERMGKEGGLGLGS